MITKIKLLLIATLSIILVSACATIVGGGATQELTIDSNPNGADIWVGNIVDGQVVNLTDSGQDTPGKVVVSRKDAVVIVKAEGYEDTNIILHKTVNGWVFGNIIIGGLIGMSVDSSTGAIHKYDPDNIFVELKAK